MNANFSEKELEVQEWIKKAEEDALSANSLLKHRDGSATVACLLSHQMAEKYLKSFLVAKRKWFPKIHELDKLTELCMEIDEDFKDLADISIFLNAFYVPTRYPGDYPEFSWTDAEEAFTAAKKIKEFVLGKIQPGKFGSR